MVIADSAGTLRTANEVEQLVSWCYYATFFNVCSQQVRISSSIRRHNHRRSASLARSISLLLLLAAIVVEGASDTGRGQRNLF
jgi:hypothetical protein